MPVQRGWITTVATGVHRVATVSEAVRASRCGRALARYSVARGALLAGGIAYTALFSVCALVVIGLTVLMALVRRDAQVRQAVVETISRAVPGVLDDGSGGLISIDQLTVDSALNPASVAAGAVLLYSATGLVGALTSGVQAMFGMVATPRSFLGGQVANLLGCLGFMVAVLVTAVASCVAGLVGARAQQMSAEVAAVAGPGIWVTAALASVLIDAATFAGLVRLSGVRVPRRDLMVGAALAAVGMGILRALGAGAVGGAARNPLLASAAVVATVVAWMHLASRLLLLVCAWVANPPLPRQVRDARQVHAHARPNYVTVSDPRTLTWPHHTVTGALDLVPE